MSGRSRLVASLAVVAVLGVALTGCGSSDGGVTAEPAPAPSGPRDGDWTLLRGSGPDGPLALVTGSPVTLTLKGSELSGRAACNSYGGSARVTDTGFVPGEIAATQMACADPAVMALESGYLGALRAVRTASLDGDRLVLRGDGVVLVLTRQAPVEPAPFEGTRWTLGTLYSGETSSSVVGEPWLLFEGGRVTGVAGCSQVAGSYRLDGTALTVSDLVLTPPAAASCTAEAAAQDEHVRSVLSAEVTVTVDGRQVTLMSGAVGLGLSAG